MDVAEASLDPLGPDLAELASLAPQKLTPLVEYVLQFLIDAKVGRTAILRVSINNGGSVV